MLAISEPRSLCIQTPCILQDYIQGFEGIRGFKTPTEPNAPVLVPTSGLYINSREGIFLKKFENPSVPTPTGNHRK